MGGPPHVWPQQLQYKTNYGLVKVLLYPTTLQYMSDEKGKQRIWAFPVITSYQVYWSYFRWFINNFNQFALRPESSTQEKIPVGVSELGLLQHPTVGSLPPNLDHIQIEIKITHVLFSCLFHLFKFFMQKLIAIKNIVVLFKINDFYTGLIKSYWQV